MTLRKRIWLGFSALVVLAAVLGGVGYYGARTNSAAIREISQVRFPGVQSLQALKVGIAQIIVAQTALLQTDLPAAERQRWLDSVAKTREEYQAALKTYAALPRSPQEEALWKQVEAIFAQGKQNNTDFFRLSADLGALELGDPTTLLQKLELFRADHFQLETLVLKLIRDHQEFAGHEDPTQCNFGKWKASVTLKNPELLDALAKADEVHRKFHVSVKQIKELVHTNNLEGATTVFKAETEPAVAAVFQQFQRLTDLALKGQARADQLRRQGEVCRGTDGQITESLDKLIQLTVQQANGTAVGSQRTAATTKTLTFSLTLLGAGVGLLLAFFLARSITRALRSVAETLDDGSSQVSAAASQVSAASQSLAEGASEQAASLEETSSSLEEMASMTQRNAENAQKANTLTRQARAAADTGAADMQAMNTAMQDIKASSDEIGKIIKTIDEIAFQTNILALNAAVEAARAGEAGMGFAVVADEVRNLAQRCAHSAKETADKIEGAITKTTQGVQLSAKVTQGLQTIVAQVRQVDELVAEVASASQEQSQGIGQVNTAVTQMDKVTQSNAANAEESASAAEELNAQAEALKEAVNELLQLVGGQNHQVTAHAVDGKPPLPPSRGAHGHQAFQAPPRAAAYSGNGSSHSAGLLVPSTPIERQANGLAHGSPKNLIEWDAARMSTGSELVDSQHQELIARINRLHEACLAGVGRAELLNLLNFLGAYAKTHFQDEERLMKEQRCPAYAENKAAHAQFLREYARLHALVTREGATTSALLQLRQMLGEWLRHHICSVDTGLRHSACSA